MKILQLIGVLFFGFLILSCSNDVDPVESENSITAPDFKMIGEDEENIYQYSYNADSQSGNQINLTQTSGLDPFYLTLRQVGEVVSFYSFAAGSFSLIQQNSSTGEVVNYPNFYTVTEERSITWGANAEDLVFMGYYQPKGSRNFGIRTLDPTDGSFTDLSIAFNIQQAYDPLYSKQRLLITYKAEDGSYKVSVFNTSTRALILTLDFETAIPNVLINDEGNIGIVLGLGNSEFLYQVYDIDTLSLLEETTFNLDRFLPPGPLQGEIHNNTLYYTNYLAQPSTIPFGPAYFDFLTDENFVIDILQIVQEAELQTQTTIALTAMHYVENKDIYLIGYANVLATSEITGGVLIVSKKGQLVDRIEVPFAPTYFIKP